MTVPGAQLWIGPEADLLSAAERFLRSLWCTQDGCGVCVICTQVAAHRYYALHWLTPEGVTYLVEQIDELLPTLQFMLQPEEHVVVVFDTAHALSAASASRLLKIMEEPPAGYHFLLLTSRPEALLPTIRSRCVVREFTSTQRTMVQEPLVQFLLNPQRQDLYAFSKELERAALTELESRQLLDVLIMQAPSAYLRRTYVNALKQSPMSGSSKLFWRNLFLQLLAE